MTKTVLAAEIEEQKAKDALAKESALGVKPTTRRGNAEIEALCATSANTPHVVAKIFFNRRAFQICMMIIIACQDVRDQHDDEVKLLREREGALEYLSGMSCGGCNSVLTETVSVLSCVTALDMIGFTRPPSVGDIGDVHFSWDDYPYEYEDELAETFAAIIRAILYQ